MPLIGFEGTEAPFKLLPRLQTEICVATLDSPGSNKMFAACAIFTAR